MPFAKARVVGEKSAWGLLTENVELSGVMIVALERDWDTVLIVVIVLDSVTVAVDSLRGITGERGSERAGVCDASSRCGGDGSRA
jgi:hypothetical protein